MHGAGDLAFLPLVALANVDERGRLRAVEKRCCAGGVDLVDLGLDLLQEVAVAVHCFQEYSDWRR